MSVVNAATVTIDTLDLADADIIQLPGILSRTRPNNDVTQRDVVAKENDAMARHQVHLR